MKNIKLFTTILLTASTLALTACGNTAPTVSAEETIKNQVVENTTTTESETAVIESVMPETTETAIESEMASEEEIIDPNYNGDHYQGTLQETTQSYITYEDITPTQMYVIPSTKGEAYAIYNDPNATEGALMMGGLVEPNQELTVDGKATYNEVDYYRLAYTEGSMTTIQYIIPAEYLSTEKPVEQQPTTETQQPSVETQKPVETQPETTTPEQSTTTTPEVPTYDPNCGISEADWNKLYGGGTSGGGINWQPDHSEDYSATVNEKGGLTITGSGFQEGGGNLTVH